MNSVKTALISVSDKTGLVEFAKELQKLGIKIISTGGTAKTLKEGGINVVQIDEVTGFPEILDGRVKTLHPKIHAGILAIRSNKEHMKKLQELKIEPIDMVCVNLYPFKSTISKPNVKLEETVENIDIGGPTIIRAAAKNFPDVVVIVSPKQYGEIVEELKKNKGEISLEMKKKLAALAFKEIAEYDSLIDNYLNIKFNPETMFPDKISLTFEKLQECRYGENPHQKAAFYKETFVEEPCISNAEQLHGKELSFNNIYDANAAIELSKEFTEATAVIVKHNNPCGVASAKTLAEAFQKAFDCDSTSAFGGVIALNKKVDLETAKKIATFFNELVIAPDFNQDALDELKKKQNVRILKLKKFEKENKCPIDLKKVVGGILLQERDLHELSEKDLKIVSEKKPSKQQIEDMLFAWKIAKNVKSNAIVFAKDKATVGIGAGQMSRIDSTKIAEMKANGRQKGAIMASDAFFPFRDNIDVAAAAGIAAIISTGGSVRDNEVIQAANEHKIALIFTGIRHFRH